MRAWTPCSPASGPNDGQLVLLERVHARPLVHLLLERLDDPAALAGGRRVAEQVALGQQQQARAVHREDAAGLVHDVLQHVMEPWLIVGRELGQAVDAGRQGMGVNGHGLLRSSCSTGRWIPHPP
jgi:hypothetical protein